MRRLLGVLAAAAIVCSLILPPVAAQEVVSAKASRVTIGGTLDFIGVLRGDELWWGDDSDGDQGTYGFFDVDYTIDLTIDMTDNVRARIVLANDWLIEGDDYDFDDFGDIYTYPISGDEEDEGLDGIGGNNNIDVKIEEAYIEVNEFLVPELALRIGIQNVVWDLRGNGDEFVLNAH